MARAGEGRRSGGARYPGRGARGAVAVVLAAILAGLLGLVGLVFDFGRGWIAQSELQAEVDAAALAGATQLDGRPGARERAVIAAAGPAARNTETLTRRAASGAPGGAPDFDTGFACGGPGCVMTNGSFRFLAELAPRAEAASDAEARFIEVTARETLRFAFAGLLGAPAAVGPRVRAVAAWRRYACGRPALILCNPEEPAGNLDPHAAFDAAAHAGTGMTLRTGLEPGLEPGPGALVWHAAVTCDAARDTCDIDPGTGALAEGLARVLPPQSCLEQARGAPAETAGLAAALNTRLDIYPDATQSRDPVRQPSPNSLSGLVPLAGGTSGACDFPGALTAPARPYLGPARHAPQGAEPLDHLGYPRDTCAYPRADGTAPPDNCMAVPPPGLPAGRALGNGVWDLPAYMAHHHPALELGTWDFNRCPLGACALGGDLGVDLDGDGRLSRWEVYRWELAGNLPRFGRAQCFGGGALPQPPADSPRATDRRLLGALVVNCSAVTAALGAEALTGAGPVPLAGGTPALHLFLSEAVGELAPDALYAEIVAPQAITGAPALVARDRVVLRE